MISKTVRPVDYVRHQISRIAVSIRISVRCKITESSSHRQFHHHGGRNGNWILCGIQRRHHTRFFRRICSGRYRGWGGLQRAKLLASIDIVTASRLTNVIIVTIAATRDQYGAHRALIFVR